MQKERLSERRFGLLPGCAHAFCLVRARLHPTHVGLTLERERHDHTQGLYGYKGVHTVVDLA